MCMLIFALQHISNPREKEYAEILGVAKPSVTDEVHLRTLQISLWPVNGNGSEFPLSRLKMWMHHCAAQFYPDGATKTGTQI